MSTANYEKKPFLFDSFVVFCLHKTGVFFVVNYYYLEGGVRGGYLNGYSNH